MTDEFHGQGGRFTVDKAGRRKRTDEAQKVPEGGGARDRHGKPLFAEPPAEHNAPSMPEPAAKEPWDPGTAAETGAATTPAAPDADKKDKGSR